MRKTILILFIFIGSSLSFAQDNNISIKEYNYEYYHYYGTEKTYVWNLVITNNSAENYLTWINKNDNVMDYAEETQIKNFFRAGRPRLFFLWSDGEYSEKILGQTFLKLLKPGESFSYNVVQKVKKEPSIKKKISIAKESVVQIYTQFKISECFDVPYLYALTIFAYMKNRFPRHSARTVGSPTHSSPPTPTAEVLAYILMT